MSCTKSTLFSSVQRIWDVLLVLWSTFSTAVNKWIMNHVEIFIKDWLKPVLGDALMSLIGRGVKKTEKFQLVSIWPQFLG
jgi:hypothetical protein